MGGVFLSSVSFILLWNDYPWVQGGGSLYSGWMDEYFCAHNKILFSLEISPRNDCGSG